MVTRGQTLPADADLVILPGSKTTIADLAVFREEGWDIDLKAHARRGGRILGLCGGYQMLGRHIVDPLGLEGPAGEVPGLGFLDVETVLTREKHLRPVDGYDEVFGAAFTGYEMHNGETSGADCVRPLLRFSDGRCDGAVSADRQVTGCYVHGLFADDAQRRAWLMLLGAESSSFSYETSVEQALDELAAHLEAHVDLDRLLSLAR
jgi:adenosylcobyric acid synthase